jgi:hypothetical protein
VILNTAAFRAAFPFFDDAAKYPDTLLQAYWDAAVFMFPYAVQCNYERALWLLMAHLIQIGNNGTAYANGSQTGVAGSTGIQVSASIDSVSISTAAPPLRSAGQWWYYQTPFGAELYMWIRSQTAGGFIVGGLPERQPFRKVYGIQ